MLFKRSNSRSRSAFSFATSIGTAPPQPQPPAARPVVAHRCARINAADRSLCEPHAFFIIGRGRWLHTTRKLAVVRGKRGLGGSTTECASVRRSRGRYGDLGAFVPRDEGASPDGA